MDLDLSRDAAALTAALVDVPSVSGDEQVLADAVAVALAGLPHLTIRRDGNAVVARTDLGRPQRVILAGHLDTVPIAGNVPSHTEGGLLYGCGSCDMKSGVAVQLRLACQLAEPSRDVTYVFYDCEEVEAERNGLLRLSLNAPELLGGDLAVLLEPTGGLIEGGCQGTMRAEITAHGVRAHSARSWRGRNAIHGAGAIIDVLRSYRPREPEVDGLVYHEGLNAVGIAGGAAHNVARGVRRVRRGDHRRGARGPARADRPGRGGVAGGGRRNPARQDGVDGRGQVRHARATRGQLRPG